MHCQSSTTVSDLSSVSPKTRKVQDALGLSFHNVKELNEVIDMKLSGHPCFQRKELSVNGDLLEFYCRDIIESIRCLYGDPHFAHHLVFVPEWHYTNHKHIKHMYSIMR